MDLRLIVIASVCVIAQCEIVNLSCKQIQTFVNGHNTRRYDLTRGRVKGHPAATDMRYMVWDEELANKAAKWAAHNKFSHNPDKTVRSGRFKTGENLYWHGTTDHSHELNVDDALKAWWEENKDFVFRHLRSSDFDGSSKVQIGHYTQMAWAKTVYVGCAMSQYMQKGWKNFLVVCNYGPAGNYLGQYPYSVTGKRRTKLLCENKVNCRQPYGSKCEI